MTAGNPEGDRGADGGDAGDDRGEFRDADRRRDDAGNGDARNDDAGDGDARNDDEDREHLRDLPDGCGCAEVWEHLSARRDRDGSSQHRGSDTANEAE